MPGQDRQHPVSLTSAIPGLREPAPEIGTQVRSPSAPPRRAAHCLFRPHAVLAKVRERRYVHAVMHVRHEGIAGPKPRPHTARMHALRRPMQWPPRNTQLASPDAGTERRHEAPPLQAPATLVPRTPAQLLLVDWGAARPMLEMI